MPGKNTKGKMSDLALLFPIVGDICGAPFEFKSYNVRNDTNVKTSKDVPLFAPPRKRDRGLIRMSDDSALNEAIVESMMEFGDKSDDECVKIVAEKLKEYYHRYPHVPGDYGYSFKQWCKTEDMKTARGSFVDGSAMRAPLIGMAYNTLEETLLRAKQSAMPTHYDPEGIKGAQAIAAAVYLARAGLDKDDIKTYIETKFDYDLDIPLKNYTEYMEQELLDQPESCPVVVPMALRAFLESEDFEDCLQKSIFCGGDSDTIAAMTSGIAGVYYGMPKKFEKKCLELVDDHTKDLAHKFQGFLKERDTEPCRDELDAVMANARLEKYVLDQYKAGNTTVPKNDPKFMDLLVKKEAARLFHEQMKEARQKNDGSDKILTANKDALLNRLTDALKDSQELKDRCDDLAAWPGKDVTLQDCEALKGNRLPSAPEKSELFPLDRKLVDHDAISKTAVTNDVSVLSAVNKYISQRKESLENLTEEVGNLLAEKDGKPRTESFCIDKLKEITAKSNYKKYFPSDKDMPGDLKEALDILKKVKKEKNQNIRSELGSSAMEKLKKLPEEICAAALMQNKNEGAVKDQLAYATVLKNVVEGLQNAIPDPPKRAFLLFRPFLSLYHKIKGDYTSFDQKMTEYNEKYAEQPGAEAEPKTVAADNKVKANDTGIAVTEPMKSNDEPKIEAADNKSIAHDSRMDLINKQAQKVMDQISEKYMDQNGKISDADRPFLDKLGEAMGQDTPEAQKMRNIFGVLDKTVFDYFKKDFDKNANKQDYDLGSKLSRYMNNNEYQAEVATEIQKDLRAKAGNANPDNDIVARR